MTSYQFIINPVSGQRHTPRKIISRIQEKFQREKQLSYDIVLTEYAGHAHQIALEAVEKGIDIVVAVGGDGTMNEVAGALLYSKSALGLIPHGSGNGLARSMGIPLRLDAAIEHLLNPHLVISDAGKINEYNFFVSTGIGFDAHIGAKFQNFGIRGPIPYFYIGFKEYFNYEYEAFDLSYNGHSIRIKPLLITIANTKQYGNGAIIAPRAEVDDGKLDLCYIDPIKFHRDIFRVPKLFTGKIETVPLYHHEFIKEVTIRRTKEEGYFHTDGEPRLGPRELKVNVLPKALRIVI